MSKDFEMGNNYTLRLERVHVLPFLAALRQHSVSPQRSHVNYIGKMLHTISLAGNGSAFVIVDTNRRVEW